MAVNAAVVTLVDTNVVLANGLTDNTGAATVAAATGALARTLSLITGTIFVTKPITMGEAGAGAFVRGIGIGAERTRGGKRTRLRTTRVDSAAAAIVGSFSVFGVNIPDALSGKPVGNAFATAQSETVSVFKAAADLAVSQSVTFDCSVATGTGLSADSFDTDSKGYNWLVVVNGEILPYSVALLTNILSFSVTAGVITVRTGSAAGLLKAGDDVVVYKLATADVTSLLAAGLHQVEDTALLSKTVIWTRWTTNQVATCRTIATVEHLVE